MAISIAVNKCDFQSYEVTISSPVEADGGDHYCTIDFGDLALAYLFSVKLDGVAVSGGCGMYFTSAGESYTLEVKILAQNPSDVPPLIWPYVVHGIYAPAWADVKGTITLDPNFDDCCIAKLLKITSEMCEDLDCDELAAMVVIDDVETCSMLPNITGAILSGTESSKIDGVCVAIPVSYGMTLYSSPNKVWSAGHMAASVAVVSTPYFWAAAVGRTFKFSSISATTSGGTELIRQATPVNAGGNTLTISNSAPAQLLPYYSATCGGSGGHFTSIAISGSPTAYARASCSGETGTLGVSPLSGATVTATKAAQNFAALTNFCLNSFTFEFLDAAIDETLTVNLSMSATGTLTTMAATATATARVTKACNSSVMRLESLSLSVNRPTGTVRCNSSVTGSSSTAKSTVGIPGLKAGAAIQLYITGYISKPSGNPSAAGAICVCAVEIYESTPP